MTNESSGSARADEVRSAPCVLFAYQEMGYACMVELLAMGAPIAALFTHADQPGEEIWWRSCAELARVNAIPIFTPERMGDAEVEIVRHFEPAVIYSFYYRNLLPDPILRLASYGAYNLHGSLLPKYRGRAPVNWMIVNGETEGGVTLHHMVARADAGDIVAQACVPIADDDTAITLFHRIVPAGATLIRQYHPLIVAGNAPRRVQDLTTGSYYGRRRPEDGRIDWTWTARRIANLVRAVTHPYPGAFCECAGRKLFIWEARVGSESQGGIAPGTIVSADSSGEVEVATGSGSLRMLRAQIENQAEQSAAEVLRGLAVARLN